MSFISIEIPTRRNKWTNGTPQNQRELQNKVTKEHLNHIPVPVAFNETDHSAVIFAPDERLNALNSFLYFPWMSSNTEYLIISDSDASDSEDQGKAKNDEENKVGEMKTTTKKNDTDPDQLKNDQQTFFDKLSTFTKDVGHFFAHPSANMRQFFRRREGYLPPDQRLIQETTSSEN